MRLEELATELARLRDLLGSAWVALGYLATAVFGGAVAFVRTGERERAAASAGDFIRSLWRRMLMAGFAGLLVFHGFEGMGKGASAWGPFVAGFCALYASEAFDLGWFILRRKVRQFFGVDVNGGTNGQGDDRSDRSG